MEVTRHRVPGLSDVVNIISVSALRVRMCTATEIQIGANGVPMIALKTPTAPNTPPAARSLQMVTSPHALRTAGETMLAIARQIIPVA